MIRFISELGKKHIGMVSRMVKLELLPCFVTSPRFKTQRWGFYLLYMNKIKKKKHEGGLES